MSTLHHTPLPFGGPLTSPAMEAPIGQLDAAIAAVIATGSGTSTTLTSLASAGQATLIVASSTGFLPGDPIYLANASNPATIFESRIVNTVPDGTHVTVTVNLTNSYDPNSTVSKSPIELVDAREGSTTLKARMQLLQTVVNVKTHGAKGDDSTNDTAAIQAAIDSLGSRGGVVFLPAGSYVIASAIKYPASDSVDHSFTLMGAGPGATKLRYTGTGWAIDTVAVGATQVGNMTLRDFGLTGSASALSGGIRLKNVHRSLLFNLQISAFTNATAIAVLIDGAGGASFGAHHNLLERLDISNSMFGIKLTGAVGAGQANANRIVASRVSTNQANGIGINIDVGDTNAIYGCNIFGNANDTTAVRIADIRNELTDSRIEFNSGSTGTVGVNLTAGAIDVVAGPVSIANAATPVIDASAVSYLRRLGSGIERILAGTFYGATITINGTTSLGLLGGSFADVPRIILPNAGSIAAVSWRFTTTPTAGNYAVHVTRSGTSQYNTGNQGIAQSGAAKLLPGQVTFTNAQGVGIEIVTDAAFLTGAKLLVWLWAYI